MKISEKKFNLWFNAFILVGMLLAVVVTNAYKFQQPGARHFMLLLASVGALTGVINTVLSANGNILTFLFGLIDVTIASYVAFDSSIRPGGDPVWGNFALHAFYFLPMQFVGWWQWRKRGASSKEKVRARRLGGSPETEGFIRTVILFDALVLVLNILGQVLMSLAFMEQWVVWILVNIFSICLWGGKALSSPDSSYTVVMVIKYIFYFLNSLNGLRIWYGLSRGER